MSRAVFLAALLAHGLAGQAPPSTKSPATAKPLPSYATPSSMAESPLAAVEALIDAGKLSEAEIAVRGYVESYPASSNAQNLLGYILFLQGNAKSSLAARG